MKPALLIAFLLVCSNVFAEKNEQFEKQYWDNSHALKKALSKIVDNILEQKPNLEPNKKNYKAELESEYIRCMADKEAIRFYRHIVDQYSAYQAMLESDNVVPASKEEMIRNLSDSITSIEKRKKILKDTEYNCS